jgi:hypothetical protein
VGALAVVDFTQILRIFREEHGAKYDCFSKKLFWVFWGKNENNVEKMVTKRKIDAFECEQYVVSRVLYTEFCTNWSPFPPPALPVASPALCFLPSLSSRSDLI